MATADISPEPSEQALHSAARLFFKLGEAFPRYVSDFHAKWDAWQQALGPSSELVAPCIPRHPCSATEAWFTDPRHGARSPSLLRSLPWVPRLSH